VGRSWIDFMHVDCLSARRGFGLGRGGVGRDQINRFPDRPYGCATPLLYFAADIVIRGRTEFPARSAVDHLLHVFGVADRVDLELCGCLVQFLDVGVGEVHVGGL
jgi:hypothetical protein